MIQDYADRFVCPRCKEGLSLRVDRWAGEKVLTGAFACASCHEAYPVRDGIPRFLKNASDVTKHTSESFGYKWRKFGEIDEFYKKNFYDELLPLDYERFFRGKIVLDAGTGMGIPSYCMAEQGAKEIYGIDISDSIEIAYKNTHSFRNVVIAQGDIYEMPFQLSFFDAVVCVAVLQHMTDPKKAINTLLSYVKPGGSLIIWVYGYEGNGLVRWFVEPFRKHISRKMRLNHVLSLSKIMGSLFHLTAYYIYKPLNKKYITFLPMNDYFLYRTNFDRMMNIHMVFDQLLAPLSHLFTKTEVEDLLDRPGAGNVRLRHHNRNSWTAICDRTGEPLS